MGGFVESSLGFKPAEPSERVATLVTEAIARTYAVSGQQWRGSELRVDFAEEVTSESF
jgi:hypothetical protein